MDNQTNIPNLFEVIERLLTGRCTNQQARHWTTEHHKRALEQIEAEQSPVYLRSVKISEDVWARVGEMNDQPELSLTQITENMETDATNVRRVETGSERPYFLNMAAHAMIALHIFDRDAELDAAGGVN